MGQNGAQNTLDARDEEQMHYLPHQPPTLKNCFYGFISITQSVRATPKQELYNRYIGPACHNIGALK